MITIQMQPGDDRDADHGIAERSAGVITVQGRGVYNPEYPHCVKVWDNTIRPRTDASFGQYNGHLRNLPGAYINPSGRPTDDAVTVLLDAQNIVFADPPAEQSPYLGVVRVGETVAVLHTDGTEAWYRVTARPYADPELVRVCPQCDQPDNGPHIQGCPLDPAQFEQMA